MKKTQFKSYDNSTAPIKDNITKTTFKMTFSKSNFMFIGKWIIAFVLIIVFGSQTLNGFISSKFTKDSTSETIVHEYKKQIGVEVVGGNFDFLNDSNYSLLNNKKIFFKKAIINELPYISVSSVTNDYTSYFGLTLKVDSLKLYDIDDNLLYSYRYSSDIKLHFNFNIGRYSNQFTKLSYTYLNADSFVGGYKLFVYGYDFFGESSFPIPLYPTAHYFTFTNISRFNVVTNSYVTLREDFIPYVFNSSFVYDYFEEIPIYETTTYTYEVRDNNYDWDTKLKQLSAFKPLFKFNQSFINDEYVKYSNLISYEYTNTESSIEEVVNRYKSDERLNPLFDNNYITIGGKTESGLFKDKTKYYSFIKFNFPLDYDIQGVSSAYNWVIDNYVTDFNIDSYLNESKYKVELKDILEIFKFPIQIVNNLVYDFGVLIGFITWW